MPRISSWIFLVLVLGLMFPPALDAQVDTIIYGRLEDAITRQPVVGARILSSDSTTSTLSDSLGNFALPLPAGSPLVLHTEGLGYLSQRFELADDAPSRLSVLLLEPAAIGLEGIDVVSAAAVSELATNLEQRRNAYGHAMRAFDRTWLNRFGPVGGSAFDLVRQRIPRGRPCPSDPSQLCVPGRGPTPSNPMPMTQYGVCIDGWTSFAPINDLDLLPIDDVALVEIYFRKQVRVYTRQWMLFRAGAGSTNVLPLWMGC